MEISACFASPLADQAVFYQKCFQIAGTGIQFTLIALFVEYNPCLLISAIGTVNAFTT